MPHTLNKCEEVNKCIPMRYIKFAMSLQFEIILHSSMLIKREIGIPYSSE